MKHFVRDDSQRRSQSVRGSKDSQIDWALTFHGREYVPKARRDLGKMLERSFDALFVILVGVRVWAKRGRQEGGCFVSSCRQRWGNTALVQVSEVWAAAPQSLSHALFPIPPESPASEDRDSRKKKKNSLGECIPRDRPRFWLRMRGL